MKFLKKTAALLFCVVLALSVMAVAAFADDEAVLLEWENGQLLPDVNNEFTVMLTKSANNLTPVKSRDTVLGYEIDPSTDVTFDITVAYNHSSGAYDFTEKTIDAFQFDFIPENNYGATISGATVNHNAKDGNNVTTQSSDILHNSNVTYFSENTANTYGYSSLGIKENDIPLPASGTLTLNDTKDTVTNGTKIGTITLSFDTATQAIDIYPQIENLLIHVRDGGTDAPQQPVATSPSNSNSSPATGTHGTVSGGKPVSNGSGNSPSTTGTVHSCVIVAPVPVIVNPIYEVTLEVFDNDTTTGILYKTATTQTLMYDFINGSFKTNDKYDDGASHSTVLSNTDPNGYTLQGWMVTADTDSSDAWAEYSSSDFSPVWNKTTSYPATTTAMAGKLAWAADGDTWYNAENSTGRVEFNPSYNYANDVAQTDINFIPVTRTIKDAEQNAVDSDYTYFPKGLTGNITLTPVYTRNVYTATFNSGDDDATFAIANIKGDANAALPSGTADDATTVTTFTKEYTIEDLTQNGARDGTLVDFLKLNDTDGETALQLKADSTSEYGNANGPWGATRKAYKFMGWTVTNSIPVSGYEWNRNADLVDTATYNNSKMLKTATYKHYGNVTFTAVWEEDIYYAEVGYWYGGSANVLVLVAVLSGANDNYDANYTYLFKPSSTASVEKMFLVPDSDQRTAYMNFAISQVGDSTSLEKFPSAMPDDYVLFAYIAAPGAVDQASVTIAEKEGDYTSGRANDTLSYNGNVDGTGAITVADFGNVDTLFNDASATNVNVFNITNYYGVRSRLQADVTTGPEESGKKFASISDIKAIYDKMGYDTTNT